MGYDQVGDAYIDCAGAAGATEVKGQVIHITFHRSSVCGLNLTGSLTFQLRA